MFKKLLSALTVAVVTVMACTLGLVGCGGSLGGGGNMLDGKWDIIAWDGKGTEPVGQVVIDNEKKTMAFNTVEKHYDVNVEFFSKGKKTDYRTKSHYTIQHKGISNTAIGVSSLSDNVMRIENFYEEKTPGELESITGKTIVRRADTKVEKAKLSGTFALPEDFTKDLGLNDIVKITEITITGDEVSFVYHDRAYEDTYTATLTETEFGYSFTKLLDRVESSLNIYRTLNVNIVETSDNYITLFYSINTTGGITGELSGATLVKA